MRLRRDKTGAVAEGGQKTGKVSLVKVVGRLLLALLIVLALHLRLAVAQSDYVLSNADYYLTKLLNSLEYYPLLDALVLLAVYLLFRYLDEHEQKADGWLLLLSGLLALLYLVAGSAKASSSLAFFYADGFQMLLSLLCLVGFWALFCLVLMMVCSLVRTEASPADRAKANRLWLLGFCAILLCWLAHVAVNYPYIYNIDGNYMVGEFLSGKVTGHHPPLSTFIMGALAWLGETLLGDRDFGQFLYILLQCVVGALVFSYSMKKLYELGAGKALCIAGLALFAIAPPWGSAGACFEKTLLYTEIVTLNLVYVAGALFTRRCTVKDMLYIALSGLLAALLRKNGIYAVVPCLIAALFCLRKSDRRRLAAALGIVLSLYLGTEKLLYPAMGIIPPAMSDMLSVPLLQTANYVSLYPDEVTEREKEVISETVDYPNLSTNYNPHFADPVKNTYSGKNEMLPEYSKVWFRMFLKHPVSYMEAFANIGYGYLAPVEESADYAYYLYGDVKTGDAVDELYYDLTVRSLYMPLIRYLAMPGAYTWVIMVCVVLLLRKKQYAAAALTVPAVMNILVCIASPLYNSIRYSLATMAAVPFILGWTLIYLRRSEPETVSKTGGQA